MKLVGDIGGTKTLLALVDERGGLTEKRRLASVDFSSFDVLLTEYCRAIPVPIQGGCLAVAGPVADDGRSAKVTNLPWTIDAAALEADFRLGHLDLVNDFAAVAAGVRSISAANLQVLQPGTPSAGGLRLVIGAGTGLGVAALAGERILPSEGGHIAFGPADEVQARIGSALMAEYGRVTAERVISGPGLAAIHRILTGLSGSPESIGASALAGEPAALGSVQIFLACYGAYAGDMALTYMARGGVYLAGGIVQKLLPLLAASPFLAAFNAKAEHAGLARQMPVAVITDADIGLRGAALIVRHAHPDFDRYQ